MPLIPTPILPHSSSGFATTQVLDPQPSALARCYWRAAHGSAFGSLLLSGWPWPLCLLLGVLLSLHGWFRRPRVAPVVVVQASGLWAVPEWGLVRGATQAGSFRTAWVLRVVLAGPDSRRRGLLLTRDALPGDQWRRLKVLLGH